MWVNSQLVPVIFFGGGEGWGVLLLSLFLFCFVFFCPFQNLKLKFALNYSKEKATTVVLSDRIQCVLLLPSPLAIKLVIRKKIF